MFEQKVLVTADAASADEEQNGQKREQEKWNECFGS